VAATLDDLRDILVGMLGEDDRPILVTSALWPLARILQIPVVDLVEKILDLLLEIAGPGRTLIMPTLTAGMRDGFCNLDTTPSTTGMLTEAFRHRPGVRRTRSVYSSYAAFGGAADDFVDLAIDDVWGEGSHFAWLEQRDAQFLMLGTHPTDCVFLHRVEWLFRDRLAYRYSKIFSGRLKHEGRETGFQECFWVRSLDPEAHQDFTVLLPRLMEGGMRRADLDGVNIACIGARDMYRAVAPAFEANPLVVLTNPEDFGGI